MKCSRKRYKVSKIYQLLTECIDWFIDNNYIKFCENSSIDDYEFKELLEFQIVEENFYLSVKNVQGKDKTDEPFVLITEDEFDIITSIDSRYNARIFHVFALIKSYIAYRLPHTPISKYPKVALVTQSLLSEKTGYLRNKIQNYIDTLCEVNALKRRQLNHTPNLPKPPYIYAVNEPGWEQELYYGALKYNSHREE